MRKLNGRISKQRSGREKQENIHADGRSVLLGIYAYIYVPIAIVKEQRGMSCKYRYSPATASAKVQCLFQILP
jgi:hypothetical protein